MRSRDLRGATNVVRRAGGDLAEDDLFCGAAAERHGDARERLLAGHEVTIFDRQELRHAQRRAARNDADLVHFVIAHDELADEGVTRPRAKRPCRSRIRS